MEDARAVIAWDEEGDEEWIDAAPGYESTPTDRATACGLYAVEENGRTIPGSFGTCFFVSTFGLFLTAAHVVTRDAPKSASDHFRIRTPGLEPAPRRALHERLVVMQFSHNIDVPLRYRRLGLERSSGHGVALAIHDRYDVAIGCVCLGPGRVAGGIRVPALHLAEVEPAAGEPVTAYGFAGARTGVIEPDAIAIDLRPRPSSGELVQLEPSHPVGPVLVHSAIVQGGASGGPLLRTSDRAVLGVSTKGMRGASPTSEEYQTSYAVDVRPVIDWPIPFLEGRTLRDLSKLPEPAVRIVE